MSDTPSSPCGGLLAALQIGDSFFPSGLFTQSHGLERFVERGLAGPEALEPLLHAYLLDLAGPCEAVAARWAVRGAAQGDMALVAAVDRRLAGLKLAPEARAASARCGRQILALGAELSGRAELRDYARGGAAGEHPGNQSVATALLCWAAGLDEEGAVGVELHGFAVSLVSAAIRLGACDHRGGQRILWQARPVLEEARALGRGRDWRQMGGFAPLIEAMQCQHAYAETHMFVS
jgi:urease accessory protein